jgi:hypothetical protein
MVMAGIAGWRWAPDWSSDRCHRSTPVGGTDVADWQLPQRFVGFALLGVLAAVVYRSGTHGTSDPLVDAVAASRHLTARARSCWAKL